MRKLTTTEQKVFNLYKEDRTVVDSDPLLYERYWIKYDGWDEDRSLYFNLSRVTPAESISRARRQLHADGLVVYSKDVDKAREKRYKEELEAHGTHPTPRIVGKAVHVRLDM